MKGEVVGRVGAVVLSKVHSNFNLTQDHTYIMQSCWAVITLAAFRLNGSHEKNCSFTCLGINLDLQKGTCKLASEALKYGAKLDVAFRPWGELKML